MFDNIFGNKKLKETIERQKNQISYLNRKILRLEKRLYAEINKKDEVLSRPHQHFPSKLTSPVPSTRTPPSPSPLNEALLTVSDIVASSYAPDIDSYSSSSSSSCDSSSSYDSGCSSFD